VSLLDRVLAPGALSVRYQPIYDLRGGEPQPVAVECLVRGPADTTLEAPDLLFEYARRKREEAAVDRAAVAAVAESATALRADLPVHVNAHASTLGRDAGFAAFLLAAFERRQVDPARVVVEIVEHTDCVEERGFLASLATVRRAGATVALDDVGSGRANFRMMLVARPDLLKIDRLLVQGVARDPYRRSILASLVLVAREQGLGVVVEGIEEAADLDAARELGVGFAQGFLLSRPLTLAQLLATTLSPHRPFALSGSWSLPIV
jgi:EAL domain-containing protein (putative c-di-GMP-specific phosphodiesterase class I)